MSNDVWGKLRYFSKRELWGDPDRMDPELLLLLDSFRHIIQHPFVLTTPAFTRAGHSENSYHYKGRAVDGRFVDAHTRQPLSLAEHLLIAIRAPFGGIGIYTWWAGGPGLHLDNRLPIDGDRKIWVSTKENQYENISLEFIRQAILRPSIVKG